MGLNSGVARTSHMHRTNLCSVIFYNRVERVVMMTTSEWDGNRCVSFIVTHWRKIDRNWQEKESNLNAYFIDFIHSLEWNAHGFCEPSSTFIYFLRFNGRKSEIERERERNADNMKIARNLFHIWNGQRVSCSLCKAFVIHWGCVHKKLPSIPKNLSNNINLREN